MWKGEEKREYMKRNMFRATAICFVVQEVFRNHLYFISLRWGSCCRELSGFTKMSTETGPSRSEAEESSGNLVPVPHQAVYSSEAKSTATPNLGMQ